MKRRKPPGGPSLFGPRPPAPSGGPLPRERLPGPVFRPDSRTETGLRIRRDPPQDFRPPEEPGPARERLSRRRPDLLVYDTDRRCYTYVRRDGGPSNRECLFDFRDGFPLTMRDYE